VKINVSEYQATIKNCQSSETGNTGEEKQTKNTHNAICIGHHYTQANINNVNKTWALIQTTGGKHEPNKHK
jgi:hypothetical protein